MRTIAIRVERANKGGIASRGAVALLACLVLLPGCTVAAWQAILGLAPVAAQVVTAGIGAASSVADSVAAQRGVPLTAVEKARLFAVLDALEAADLEERRCRDARADAGVAELPALLDREAEAAGARAVAQLEVARLLAALAGIDAGITAPAGGHDGGT